MPRRFQEYLVAFQPADVHRLVLAIARKVREERFDHQPPLLAQLRAGGLEAADLGFLGQQQKQ
ncbi:hypothetical protein [Xanthomonas theicola]|nr:hypothetical protein [Xanthomonas theicola]